MYQYFDLPLPTLVPEERARRLLAFRSSGRFFSRLCDLSGESILSIYPATVEFPVYADAVWFSNATNNLVFGREYDPYKPFIEQLFALWNVVPRPAMVSFADSDAPNLYHAQEARDSLWVSDVLDVESCCYSHGLTRCRLCADCLFVADSSECYECLDCVRCSRLRWSEHCHGCDDSWFLFNCNDCRNCLFCANLTGKEYYIWNRPVSAAEFAQTLENYNFAQRPMVESAKDQFFSFLREQPMPHCYTDEASCSGNYLRDSRRILESYCCRSSSNLAHCQELTDAQDCLDGIGFGYQLKESAQFVSVGFGARRLVNCVECWDQVEELAYSAYCQRSRNLFGCVGLREQEYCILNKQYSAEEYRSLRQEIVKDLRAANVWGMPLPPAFSSFSYEHSAAGEIMPLSKVQAAVMGFQVDESRQYSASTLLEADQHDRFSEMPSGLREALTLDVENSVFLCEMTGQPFQLSQRELELYHLLGVAPPARSFEQRHRERMTRLSPRRMLQRPSDRSGKLLRSAFPDSWRQPVLERKEWLKFVEADGAVQQ